VASPAALLGAHVLLTTQEIPEALESPLPGGIAQVVRWFLSEVPPWIQVGGLIVGGIAALLVLWWAWRHRGAIAEWIRARRRGWQIGMATAGLLVVVAVITSGTTAYRYVNYDNDFCTGCHLMGPAFTRFTESQHSELYCKACHAQSLFDSARQFLWWVAERPEAVREHSPVANAICVECHVTEDATDKWERISATAGHRVHFESDSSSLAGLMCVTCHGEEVHVFMPANETCGQAECHAEEETRIVLGAMAEQTDFHCATCHRFTARVSEVATVDTIRQEMIPRVAECFSCHDMESQLVTFDAETEPHDAVCGTCHNPHDQSTPADAFDSCAAAGCHARADTLTPFHRGLPEGTLEECARCHEAHEWAVDGQNCRACHGDVGGTRPAGRMPPGHVSAGSPSSSASSALVRLASAAPGFTVGLLQAGPSSLRKAGPAPQERAPFDHQTHASVACTECHSSVDAHGEHTVRRAADCSSCHHRDAEKASCASCHTAADLTGIREVRSEVVLGVWSQPRGRWMAFDHEAHGDLECAECHVVGEQLTVDVSCGSCHAEHHGAEAACEACHEQPPAEAHPYEVHTGGCGGSGCHAAAEAYAGLPRTRSLCLSCHQDLVDHEPDEGCAGCHMVPAGQLSGATSRLNASDPDRPSRPQAAAER